jgi:hypothetical protein
MAILKFVSGEATGSAIPITGASQRVGRAEANDLRVPDASVSGTHCEISLDGGGNLLVVDLGSTNGTFVEGQRVTKALVQSGQRLRLGNIEMLFEGDAPAAPRATAPAPVALNLPPPPVRVTAPVAPVAAAPVAVPESAQCHAHVGIAAVAVCDRCGKQSCGSCTKQQKIGRNIVHFCGACGGKCRSFAEAAKADAVEAARTKTFGAAVARSFSYPFKGNGLILLGCGTVFFSILSMLQLGRIGILGLALRVLFWGYLFAVMQRILVSSAQGEETPPEFPEVSDWVDDLLTPFKQLFFVFAASFGPGIIAAIYLDESMEDLADLILFAGVAYFPMGLLGVAMSDSFTALNPVFVFGSIFKVTGQYIVTCLFFAVLGVLFIFVEGAVASIPIPVIPHFVFWLVFLYTLLVSMRVLGMLYCINKKKLGWGL